MNQQMRKQFYPKESYNNRFQKQRWDEDNNIYINDSANWNIALGNGKRLNRKWRKCNGLRYVRNQYGEHKAIYNENFDTELQKASMILHYNLTVMKTSTLHDYSNNAYTIRKLLTLEPVNGSNTNFTTQ